MSIDGEFASLPLDELAAAALEVAGAAGAAHADLRVQRARTGHLALRDGRLASSADGERLGLAVRVLLDGVWGFAATDELTTDAAARTARHALDVARTCAPLAAERTELAPEPVHRATWVGPGEVDPFAVPAADRVRLLSDRSAALLATSSVEHVDADVQQVKEQKFYADLSGSRIVQQRLLIHPEFTVVGLGTDGPESLRTLAGPSARGWEYLTGSGESAAWDWDAELAELPELLAERLVAPGVEAGRYDLVIDPTNLWLTIHESVGHATELDRSLGYEAAYAGTSFATLAGLGTLRYGSELMTVTGDRTAEFACATVGFDDEGVATTQWDLVRDGVLSGFQLDRAMAARTGLGRSNGCAYADSALSVPVQRMANVSLQPRGDSSTADLIGGVEDGLYVVGDRSWSIDMQRYNFQFTGQRFYRIRGGRLAGQVKDAAYQGSTPSFWGSLRALGGPQTYVLGGAPNCGKAQPGQTAWVSHGCPSALFSQVSILNTLEEAGR
ncbi:TldD/PmbA family protein [Spongisporangium articulatum]|uniref:TldD/PmbA family protein n=1 Tax=Spongisporangium articulatum TaxID=3362603 RepID=A0ABW8ATV1_9ACTN